MATNGIYFIYMISDGPTGVITGKPAIYSSLVGQETDSPLASEAVGTTRALEVIGILELRKDSLKRYELGRP